MKNTSIDALLFSTCSVSAASASGTACRPTVDAAMVAKSLENIVATAKPRAGGNRGPRGVDGREVAKEAGRGGGGRGNGRTSVAVCGNAHCPLRAAAGRRGVFYNDRWQPEDRQLRPLSPARGGAHRAQWGGGGRGRRRARSQPALARCAAARRAAWARAARPPPPADGARPLVVVAGRPWRRAQVGWGGGGGGGGGRPTRPTGRHWPGGVYPAARPRVCGVGGPRGSVRGGWPPERKKRNRGGGGRLGTPAPARGRHPRPRRPAGRARGRAGGGGGRGSRAAPIWPLAAGPKGGGRPATTAAASVGGHTGDDRPPPSPTPPLAALPSAAGCVPTLAAAWPVGAGRAARNLRLGLAAAGRRLVPRRRWVAHSRAMAALWSTRARPDGQGRAAACARSRGRGRHTPSDGGGTWTDWRRDVDRFEWRGGVGVGGERGRRGAQTVMGGSRPTTAAPFRVIVLETARDNGIRALSSLLRRKKNLILARGSANH